MKGASGWIPIAFFFVQLFGLSREENLMALTKANYQRINSLEKLSRRTRDVLADGSVIPVQVDLSHFAATYSQRLDRMGEECNRNYEHFNETKRAFQEKARAFQERENRLKRELEESTRVIEQLRRELSRKRDEVGKTKASLASCLRTSCSGGSDWKAIGSSRFKVFKGPVDWATAKSKCASEKLDYPALSKTFYGHLAYDKSDEIHAFLRKEHQRLGNDKQAIWLGSTDVNSEGVWKWGDYTKVASPGHWNYYRKSRGNGPENSRQHCMAIGWKTSDNWDDQQCDDEQLYACQIDLVWSYGG